GDPADGVGLRDIAGIALGLACMARREFRCGRLRGLLVKIEQGDLGAEFSEAFGEAAAQNSASAGDDCGASTEVEQILKSRHGSVPVDCRLRSRSSTNVKSSSESMSIERSCGISNNRVSG